MIINLRGTSGSGKSTIARQLMSCYGPRTAFYRSGRRQPIGYVLDHPIDAQEGRKLAVVGHYETACGGCDTLPSYEVVTDLVKSSHNMGYDVFFEGLLVSGDAKYTGAMFQDGYPLHVLGLDLDPNFCVESVNMRRRAKNPEKGPVNPKNTLAKVRCMHLSMERLKAIGVPTEMFTERSAAFSRIKELLNVS